MDVDLATGQVQVQYEEGKVTREAMVAAITDVGYTVES